MSAMFPSSSSNVQSNNPSITNLNNIFSTTGATNSADPIFITNLLMGKRPQTQGNVINSIPSTIAESKAEVSNGASNSTSTPIVGTDKKVEIVNASVVQVYQVMYNIYNLQLQ